MNTNRVSFAAAWLAGVLTIVLTTGALAQKPDDSQRDTTLRSPAEVVRRVVIPTEIPGVTTAAKTSDGNVYFGSQPSAESIEALKQQGVKVVINLRRAEELEGIGFDEKAAVEAAGMKYVHVPMGSELPTAEALKPVIEKLGAADDERVFLHCASSNRVGAVWAVYEGTKGGKSADEAVAEGKKAGLKAPALEADAKARIEEAAKE